MAETVDSSEAITAGVAATDPSAGGDALVVREYNFTERPSDEHFESHAFHMGGPDDEFGRTTVRIHVASGVNYPSRIPMRVRARTLRVEGVDFAGEISPGGE
jgi:hypothetical protein